MRPVRRKKKKNNNSTYFSCCWFWVPRVKSGYFWPGFFLMLAMEIEFLAIPVIRVVGVTAGILTSISTVPQLLKIVKDKKANDVSISFLLILIAGLILWIWYACAKHDFILLFANAFSAIINFMVLFFKYLYRHNS
jgi:MtN3 and saliva related transmembrane protein